MTILDMSYEQSLEYPGTEGQIARITMLDGSSAMAIFRNGEFVYINPMTEVSDDSSELQLNLYDLNKQIINQLPILDKDGIEKAITTIHDYKQLTNNNFYMLYGKEISYFTLFQKEAGNDETLGEVVISCLNNIGDIVSVEPVPDAIEAWVLIDGDATCLYLFAYDSGVVPYGND